MFRLRRPAGKTPFWVQAERRDAGQRPDGGAADGSTDEPLWLLASAAMFRSRGHEPWQGSVVRAEEIQQLVGVLLTA